MSEPEKENPLEVILEPEIVTPVEIFVSLNPGAFC